MIPPGSLVRSAQRLQPPLALAQPLGERLARQRDHERPAAQAMLSEVFEVVDRSWRGIGTIPQSGWKSTYWKLRRRGAFDFPVLGVAAAVRLSEDSIIEESRVALGAVASRPFLVEKANDFLRGKPLSDEVIEEASRLVGSRAKPMDNADLDLYWRKDMAATFAKYALRELRGDDMKADRLRIARYETA